jgi:phosphate transport system substrate-binding protein
MRLQTLRLIAAALPFFLFSVAQSQTPPSLLPGFTAENYPRVNGSTSTAPIGQLLASRVAGVQGEWRRVPSSRWSATSMLFTYPVTATPEEMARCDELTRRNAHRGTHEAYTALVAGQADVILAARAPSLDELRAAQAKNVAFDARPVAMDALVFLVNKANPVRSLTLEQIRQIYAGRTNFWREVGGRDFPIKRFGRDANSGSQELMLSLVMKEQKMAPAAAWTLLTGMGEIIVRVAETPEGIGYSVFYYEEFMAPHPNNKVLAVNGVLPSARTIRSGQYPLVAPVFVVTRATLPADSPAARLRAWLLSRDGQELIAASGYVPLPAAVKETP